MKKLLLATTVALTTLTATFANAKTIEYLLDENGKQTDVEIKTKRYYVMLTDGEPAGELRPYKIVIRSYGKESISWKHVTSLLPYERYGSNGDEITVGNVIFEYRKNQKFEANGYEVQFIDCDELDSDIQYTGSGLIKKDKRACEGEEHSKWQSVKVKVDKEGNVVDKEDKKAKDTKEEKEDIASIEENQERENQ